LILPPFVPLVPLEAIHWKKMLLLLRTQKALVAIGNKETEKTTGCETKA
jgi:hypothetical protein